MTSPEDAAHGGAAAAETATPSLIDREGARARWRAARRARVARYAEALQVARLAAGMLRDRFGATRVVLFGSLVDPARFHPTSDIDLAASGIEGVAFYTAVAHLQDMGEGFEIDLVEPETCRPGLREAIEAEGIVLWSQAT